MANHRSELMILLVATRLDAEGKRFRYTIKTVETAAIFTTENSDVAANELLKLKVKHPFLLLSHVREWGFIEVFERSQPVGQDPKAFEGRR